MIVTAAYVGPPFQTTSDHATPMVVPASAPLGDASDDSIQSGLTVLAVLAFGALAFGIVNLGKKKSR